MRGSGVGIFLDSDGAAANSGVTLTGNRSIANAVADCSDTGTGNRSVGNTGIRSTPAGLCGLR